MSSDGLDAGSVAIRLVGGLGNQMFQYAAALSLAERRRKALFLDKAAFEAYRTWPYQLDRLKIPQDIYRGAPLGGVVSGSLAGRMIRKLKGGVTLRKGVYQEPHLHFDPAFFRLTGQEILLDGYFQSPRYFAGVETLLRERFQPVAPLTPIASVWAERIAASPCAVSLHVRRGDYVTTAAAVHAAIDQGYYDRAAALIQSLIGPQVEFFLFSDEPDFVAEAFSGLPNAHVVRSDPTAAWEDMFLMARCRHHIIANSSYSWWGAWLNPNHTKRVIAPARWFTPDKLATCNVLDIYPDDWILLK